MKLHGRGQKLDEVKLIKANNRATRKMSVEAVADVTRGKEPCNYRFV